MILLLSKIKEKHLLINLGNRNDKKNAQLTKNSEGYFLSPISFTNAMFSCSKCPKEEAQLSKS